MTAKYNNYKFYFFITESIFISELNFQTSEQNMLLFNASLITCHATHQNNVNMPKLQVYSKIRTTIIVRHFCILIISHLRYYGVNEDFFLQNQYKVTMEYNSIQYLAYHGFDLFSSYTPNHYIQSTLVLMRINPSKIQFCSFISHQIQCQNTIFVVIDHQNMLIIQFVVFRNTPNTSYYLTRIFDRDCKQQQLLINSLSTIKTKLWKSIKVNSSIYRKKQILRLNIYFLHMNQTISEKQTINIQVEPVFKFQGQDCSQKQTKLNTLKIFWFSAEQIIYLKNIIWKIFYSKKVLIES
ncbi:hypothetical protein ABPG74_017251 [Tetrahymena malaccensis]